MAQRVAGILGHRAVGASGTGIGERQRDAGGQALERYVDEALLRGWDPGAAKPPAVASSDDGEEGLSTAVLE